MSITFPKDATLANFKNNFDTHLKEGKIRLRHILLSRRSANVLVKSLYWKGHCTLRNTFVVSLSVLEMAVSDLYCR